MATVPLSPGTTNLTVNVDVRLHEKLTALAKRNGVSLSEYCRRILIYAVLHQAMLQDGVVFSEPAALNESSAATTARESDRPANYRRK